MAIHRGFEQLSEVDYEFIAQRRFGFVVRANLLQQTAAEFEEDPSSVWLAVLY